MRTHVKSETAHATCSRPTFYDPTPPAPTGIQWWHYKAGVPPLPEPGTINPNFTGYGWRYDPSWKPTTYTFNNMDTVRPISWCIRTAGASRAQLLCAAWL